MTLVAIALAVLALVALALALALVQLLRSQQRAHARREDLLLNQLLHLVGKPWQTAPAEAPAPSKQPPAPGAPRFTATPEAFEGAVTLADLPPLEGLPLIPSDWSEAR